MTLADWLRGIGAALIGFGIMCFPVGLGVSPKRDLSRFNNLADLGLFVKAGAVLVLCGGLSLIVAAMVSRKR